MNRTKIIGILLAIQVGTVHAFCFDQAAREYQVDPLVLKAIAIHESRLKPDSKVWNTNNTYDYGLMGINSVHLKNPELIRAGYGPDVLLEPCTNVRVGAWLLRQKIQKWGENWKAVGAYHSETPGRNEPYQWLIYRVYDNLRRQIAEGRLQ